MLLLRRSLYYFFFLVYCVACPLIILYALGYILKPGSEHGLAKTGLIYLATLPPGAVVHVENKRFLEKTPTMIRGLLPANYRVAVSLKGYRPWTRTIPVQAEKAAVFDNILLLPGEPRYERLLTEEFNDLIPAGSERFLLLAKGPLLEDLFLYDLEDETLSPAVPGDFSFGGARVVSHSSSAGGENLLVHAQSGPWWGEEKFFWIPLSHKTGISDVTRLFRDKPRLVDWDSRRPSQLFAWTDGVLNRLDVLSGAIYPKFMEGVRAYGLSEKKLYVVDEDDGFQKMDLEGKNREGLEEDAPWTREFLTEGGVYQIKIFAGDKALFLGRRGRLLSSESPHLLADEGVSGVEPDPASQKVLIWGRDRLGIFDFAGGARDRGGFFGTEPRGGGVRWVVERPGRIAQAFWVYEGSHVLFRDADRVYLLELAKNAPPGFHEYLEVKRGSSVVYMEKSGRVYYLEKTTGQLCRAEIVPKAEALFPKERAGGRGV
ncbi:MAG: PEGA domain-containing protein [Candidatus Omnitrophica bacterium]|nr:PEGA domain-containing protein [Candidatus Omnitrophota bacterium]